MAKNTTILPLDFISSISSTNLLVQYCGVFEVDALSGEKNFQKAFQEQKKYLTFLIASEHIKNLVLKIFYIFVFFVHKANNIKKAYP